MNRPIIEGALENINSTCQKRLGRIFNKGIPEDIFARYMQELSFLEKSDVIDDYEIFRQFSGEAQNSSSIIILKGAIAGSVISYLLRDSSLNPFPSYYYCEACGYYEKSNTKLFGIDLPQKKCPHCGNDVVADGFNLPVESVWGNHGNKTISFEYDVSSGFFSVARHALERLYPGHSIVPWGMFELGSGVDGVSDKRIRKVSQVGYIVLPIGNTIEDYPNFIGYLENGEVCITGDEIEFEDLLFKTIYLYPSGYLDELAALQHVRGICVNKLDVGVLRNVTWNDICNVPKVGDSLRILFREFKPGTYKDMIALTACVQNTFSWQETGNGDVDLCGLRKMLFTDTFKECSCFTREDFFEYLLDLGIERGLAFDASEYIRKGYANSDGEFRKRLFELPIPDAVKAVAKNYCYVSPRARCLEYMLIYAGLAYYMKSNCVSKYDKS